MKTLFKSFVTAADNRVVQIDLPRGAIIRCGGYQGRELCLWFEVESEETEVETRSVIFCGTGRPLPEGNLAFINTFQIHEEGLVFHVYEIKHPVDQDPGSKAG